MIHSPHLFAEHSPALIGLAALLCLAGSWATSRFFQRIANSGDGLRADWLLLTSVSSGVTIWCTHFVAMLGYHADMPIGIAWAPTLVSLTIAVIGSAAGFTVAVLGDRTGSRPAVGGAIVGISIATMHYVGMSAMRTYTPVSWSVPIVVLSVVLGGGLSIAALHIGGRPTGERPRSNAMALLYALAILSLHFTGMWAFSITHSGNAMTLDSSIDRDSESVLAVAIAIMALATIGAGMVGYLIDGSTRAAALERFRTLAMHDSLTGLPNRTSLGERLELEIIATRESSSRLSLAVIDIDGFKEINDLRGHPVGDEVLRTLGHRMTSLVDASPGTFIARIGGDEFVALHRLESAELQEELDAFLRELLDVSSAPIEFGSDVIRPQASIGAAIFPEDATDAETLISNADLALYRAKADPYSQLCLYDPAIDERTRSRQGLLADLREAMVRDEFLLHYQVQTALPKGDVLGYEALLRWDHPKHGLVSPTEFIPLAESSRLIVTIGAWVLHQACAEAVRWDPPYRVSVNVSPVQLSEPGLVDTVRAALAASGLSADRLELEMTETAVFNDRDQVMRTLVELKAMGVGLALDDFGVGYSSLDVLRSFPFDRLKIDRSFLTGTSPQQTIELIQTVLTLGRTFGMTVIAEGIETPEQRDLLTLAGCLEAQGFLFGRPSSPDDIARTGQFRRSGGLAAPIIGERPH